MDCAAKFEQDVAAIPGVSRVELNFAAAKITIEGAVARDAIAEIGKAHKISIRPDREAAPQVPFWKANPYVIPTIIATIFAVAGQVAERVTAQEIFSIVLYSLAIVTGGFTTASRGIRNLLRLQFDMDVLMTIAVAGAAAIGE